jgi:hypothetical protein
MTNTKLARARFAPLLVSSLLFAGALGAQGLSYDMSTVASGPDRSGNVSTHNMSTAHGQFAGGNSRIDIIESMAPGGMMSTGTYMITNGAKGLVTSVDPAKRQYTVIDIAELGKTATDMQNSLGGVAKTEIANVKVSLEDLGAGEPLDGYATYKYRLTQSFTMNMTVMGRTMSTPSQSTTEIWVAPQLDGLMDPSSRPPMTVAPGPMAELTKQLVAEYSKMRKGLMLKRVSTRVGGSGGHERTTTVTTMITNVKKSAISPSVFEVPAGYTKVAMFDAMAEGAPAQHARPER